MKPTALSQTRKLQYLAIAGSVLLAGLLTLIAWLWWQDRRQSETIEVAAVTASQLRIERPGFPAIALQRNRQGHWFINEPCELPVNEQRLQPLLEALKPSAHSYDSREVDLQAAGLIEPLATLQLDARTLRLGDSDLSGERRYLQRGDRVEFVPEWTLSMINGGLSALARPAVFPNGLQSLHVDQESAGNPDIDSQSDGKSDSQSEDQSDDQSTTDDAAIQLPADILDQWRELQARQIVGWPLPDQETPLDSRLLHAQTDSGALSFELHDFSRFAAIRFENAACAYIIERSSLPEQALH